MKLVLPGPIDTEIWDQPRNDPSLLEVEKVSARECAAGIVAAMEGEGFEYYVPPVYPNGVDARAMVVSKHENCDQYVQTLATVVRSLRT